MTHDCVPERRSHVSVNAAFWNPVVGGGIVYGTNRGHLRMCEIGKVGWNLSNISTTKTRTSVCLFVCLFV